MVYLTTMTRQQINTEFTRVVNDKALMKLIAATKYQVYNWRRPERVKTSLAVKLEVLFKLDLLIFKSQ